MWHYIRNWFRKDVLISGESPWKKIEASPESLIVRWQELKGCVMEDRCESLWYSKGKQMYMLVYSNGKKLYICKETISNIQVIIG